LDLKACGQQYTRRPCLKDKIAMQKVKLNFKEETMESPFGNEE
jgi:hypothetical protein